MPANKPKFKISYNCPVVLTYAAVPSTPNTRST